MKKLVLALVCLIGVAFCATSCDPVVENPQPTIAILAAEGYATDGAIVNLDETIYFGFVVASNPETNKELKSLVVTIDDTEWYNNQELAGTSFTYTDSLTFSLREIIGSSVINAIVTDMAGETATATINLNINQDEEPLEVTTINWIRRGANLQGTTEAELSNVGLKWSGSYKEIFATLEALEGTQLYICDGNDFENIVTAQDMASYYNALAETGLAVNKYRNVTTAHSSDYNDMLFTKDANGELHAILIKRAEIETGNFGTQITIIGSTK